MKFSERQKVENMTTKYQLTKQVTFGYVLREARSCKKVPVLQIDSGATLPAGF